MTRPIDAQMPPLPDTRLRYEIALTPTGERLDYTANQMHAYAQAHAAQQCAELAAKLVAADDASGWKQAFENEQKKFQAETLRTSKQASLLQRWFQRTHDKGCRTNFFDRLWQQCDDCELMRETQELNQTPINDAMAAGCKQ